MRWVDKFLIVEWMDKWVSSCDDEENGFVITNLFKTILEDEIKVREKIVDDFCVKLKPNPLDWNLNNHTMKPKKDILVFTRKLLESLKLWGVLEKKDPIVDPG